MAGPDPRGCSEAGAEAEAADNLTQRRRCKDQIRSSIISAGTMINSNRHRPLVETAPEVPGSSAALASRLQTSP